MKRIAYVAVFTLVAGLAGCASTPVAPIVERAPGGQPAEAPAARPAEVQGDTYTVKRGDTLYGIALDHGLDYRELAEWNGITNSNMIHSGDVLRLRSPAPAVQAESSVQVKPITGVGRLESRPLESRPLGTTPPEAKPGEAKPPEIKPPGPGAAVAAAPKGPDETTIARVEPRGSEARSEARAPAAKPEAEAEPGIDDEDKLDWIWPVAGKVVARFSDPANKGVDIAAKQGDPVIASAAGRVVYSGSGLRGYGKLIIIKHNKTFLSAYAHNNQILVKEGQNVEKGQKIGVVGATDADSPRLHFEIRRMGKPVDPLKFLPEARQ